MLEVFLSGAKHFIVLRFWVSLYLESYITLYYISEIYDCSGFYLSFVNLSNIVLFKAFSYHRFTTFNRNNFIRFLSNSSSSNNIAPEKLYDDIVNHKTQILEENKGKSGVYLWNNIVTGKCYVGSSTNIRRRFISYFSLAFLKKKC